MKAMVNGLISGNFHWWGQTQYQQYHRLIGHIRRVGIELEMRSNLTLCQAEQLLITGFKFSREENHEECVNQRNKEFEIQFLFNVYSPQQFYSQAVHVYNTLYKLGLPTYGSTHVNMQIRHGKQDMKDTFMERYPNGDYKPTPEKEFERFESKDGPVWTNHKELIAGILTITSLREDVARYCDCTVRPKLVTFREVYRQNRGLQ